MSRLGKRIAHARQAWRCRAACCLQRLTDRQLLSYRPRREALQLMFRALNLIVRAERLLAERAWPPGVFIPSERLVD